MRFTKPRIGIQLRLGQMDTEHLQNPTTRHRENRKMESLFRDAQTCLSLQLLDVELPLSRNCAAGASIIGILD